MTSKDAVVDWLLGDGRQLLGAAGLMEQLAPRLIAAGVPLWRITFHLPQLHPLLSGELIQWRTDRPTADRWRVERSVAVSRVYHHSPVALMHRTGEPVRRRLAGPGAELEFPVLEELRAEGGTDYLLLPMAMNRRVAAGLGIMTRDPDGFAEEHLALMTALAPVIGAVAQIYVERETTAELLDTYVGHVARDHILGGQVVRGSGLSIRAVILFSDMRDFTRLSEDLPRPEVLSLLNDYFAVIVGAVHEAGGEVLKYLGDGLLAVFRITAPEQAGEACARSLIAVLESIDALERANRRRAAAGQATIRAGIALHLGNVMYGNIGADNRLDFTVIGPAVNLAARLERLTKTIDQPVLTSGAFAEACPVALRALGEHHLEGVREPQPVHAPMPRRQAAGA